MTFVELKEAGRMLARARRIGNGDFRRYQGSAEEICRQIIDDCWDADKRYFRVSNGHFLGFYVRDFAHAGRALVDLGFKDRVNETLRWALGVFERHGQIEQSISREGKPFSFPAYSPDALGLLLYVLDLTNNRALVKRHRKLLQHEADRFARAVIDPKTLLPYLHKRFSAMRDHAWRPAACYDAVMAVLVAKYAERFGLEFPYKHKAMAEKLVETYWNGNYFFSDLNKRKIVTGDANVFPFWTNVLEGVVPKQQIDSMTKKAMRAMHQAGLDDPWPLRYVSAKDVRREGIRLNIANLFAKGYQTDSIWMNIGLCMLDVQVQSDPPAAKRHIERVGELITEHGTFLELYDKTGQPFKTFWYVSDEAMLWCAQWLRLSREVR